jgi:hypothetical protein
VDEVEPVAVMAQEVQRIRKDEAMRILWLWTYVNACDFKSGATVSFSFATGTAE